MRFHANIAISIDVPSLFVHSIGLQDYKPSQLLHFHNTGLGGSDRINGKGWRIRTFPSLLRENNHTEVGCVFFVRLLKHNLFLVSVLIKTYQVLLYRKRLIVII